MKDDEIQKFLDENDELFKSLSQNLWCPCCKKVTKPPFFNLGEVYDSFEGCFDCYRVINGIVNT